MAVKIRRSYKGAAVSTTLDTSGVTSATQTSIALATSPSTWPTGKFFVVVAPGTTQEEKMCVTVSGSTLTVVDPAVTSTAASANGRGVDNTTARSAISGGAVVYPVFTAIDADEANELTSTYSAQGHIVYQGASTFTGLGIGTAGQVLKVNSGATAPEWGQVATAGLADGAVTLAKLASAVANALVPVGTITAYGGATAPTGWLLCDGSAISGSYTSLIALVGANTPDLRGRFPMGKTASGTGSTLLGTGGSNTIAEGNLPAHTHGVGTLDIQTGGAHNHTGTVDAAGSHNHTGTVDAAGGHSHGAGSYGIGDHDHAISGKNTSSTSHTHTGTTTVAAGISGGTDVLLGTGSTVSGSVTGTSAAVGDHQHTFTTSTVGNHQHTFTTSTATAHDHGITGSTASTGSGTDYYQPFTAVNYIIKHD